MMDTPAIADFPDDLDQLREWQRRRAAAEERERVAEALKKELAERTEADWRGLRPPRLQAHGPMRRRPPGI
jgi:hypothetical protein